jgi:23S rRNA pseudouridine1911/1915/1917 synthase
MSCVGSRERPGVVHRLDIETSGVMVFAKTQAAYRALRRQFESHQGVVKRYLAVVHGAPETRTGSREGPVGRERLHAVTHWEVLARKGPVSLVEFTIETGRTHQIRVHAAHMGHPVVGDSLYGNAAADRRLAVPPRRQLLHALGLAFNHPVTGEPMEFMVRPPSDIVYAH